MFRTSFGQLRPNVRTFNGDAGGSGGDQPQADGQAETDRNDGGVDDAQAVASLPGWAQTLIGGLRKESADHRTKARSAAEAATQAAATAASERQALLDDFATKLGLKSEKPDADQLTKQLGAAQQAQRDTQIELAVYRAAGQHKGNPDALLDSKAFLANVSSLDPTSSDFPTQVSDAVKTAIGSNPSLRLVQATGSSAADHAGGSGEQGAITEQQLASMTPEQIDKAFREGRLKHLL